MANPPAFRCGLSALMVGTTTIISPMRSRLSLSSSEARRPKWPWRADFKAVCAKGGLAVEEMRLPAPEDVRLLTIMRASDVEESE